MAQYLDRIVYSMRALCTNRIHSKNEKSGCMNHINNFINLLELIHERTVYDQKKVEILLLMIIPSIFCYVLLILVLC